MWSSTRWEFPSMISNDGCRRIIIILVIFHILSVQEVYTTNDTLSCERDFKPVLLAADEVTIRTRTYNGLYDTLQVIANFTGYFTTSSETTYEVSLARVFKDPPGWNRCIQPDDIMPVGRIPRVRKQVVLSSANGTVRSLEVVFDQLKAGCYRISLCPLDGSQCQKNREWQTDVFFVPDIKSMCSYWFGDIITQPKARDQEIAVVFQIFSKFNCCFDNFTIDLFKVPTEESYCGAGNKSHREFVGKVTGVPANKTVALAASEPGFYCVQVSPSDNHVNGIFRKLHSEPVKVMMIEVTPQELVITPASESLRSKGPPTYVLPLILTVVLTIILVLILILSWFVFVKRKPAKPSSTFEDIEKDRRVINTVSLFLLYSHESEAMDELVKRFVAFLTNCCCVKVLYDEDDVDIRISDDSWIAKLKTYWSSNFGKASDKKVVLIIESQGTSKWQKARQQQKPTSENEELLNIPAQRGMAILESDPRSVWDCSGLMVVRFSFTPASAILQDVVEDLRFLIPDNLVDLYCALWELKSSSQLKSSLMDQWKTSPAYKDLMDYINYVKYLIQKKNLQ